MDTYRKTVRLDLDAHGFTIEVERFIAHFHQELEACFCFFGSYHDVVQVHCFAFDEAFAHRATLLLELIDAFDELTECIVEGWALRRRPRLLCSLLQGWQLRWERIERSNRCHTAIGGWLDTLIQVNTGGNSLRLTATGEVLDNQRCRHPLSLLVGCGLRLASRPLC